LNANNKKLITNIGLMFLVYFLPKVFSFFLVPIYTSFLTTEEYGISDLIINTASLISPFVALSTTSAVMRFTIENKEDKRPYQISLKIYSVGMVILFAGLAVVQWVGKINPIYLFFLYAIVGTSLLSDIDMNYTRGLEKMKVITFCGVGGSLVGILCNILFIVVFKMGLYGFLIASSSGYLFTIIVLAISNRKMHLFKNIISEREPELQREMLQFSIPSIFSGLSWWVVSSSDRYFVSAMCGTAANGIYSVAYKIPTMLQAVHNVFIQAWTYTVYDSYNSEDGKKYIARVYDVYVFVLCLGCSFLIATDIFISKILYSNDFFEAWKYVPPLLLSIVFNSAAGLMNTFLSVYKKTRVSMRISFVVAGMNIILNWLFISIFNDALGAAIATAITFFTNWICSIIVGMRVSGVKISWRKQFLMYVILTMQAAEIILFKNMYVVAIGIVVIVILNWNTIVWARSKWNQLIKFRKV
jgi:O-antigen/teichoic acid export membrane protein